ncbi:response regulator [Paenibacillus psychroresistens]|uniref:Circadian input-output histidine kinase CikA n=2 Tax=Paenibacillus psychroresistens TaxID=1778678 RepID=A0A6B8RUL2_9BACL|nr:response regulator [Paenibacillus psychroresistens]
MSFYTFILTSYWFLSINEANLTWKIQSYTEFVIPIFLYLFYEQMTDFKIKKIARRLWQIHLIFAFSAIFLIEAKRSGLTSMFVPFDLLTLGTFSLMFVMTAAKVLRGDYEARVFMLGLLAFIISGFYDLLRALHIIDASSQLVTWGFFGFVIALTFIMGRRFQRVYNRIEDQNLELEKMNKLKDEFLANTSHELRTPLHGIIGISESILNGIGGPINDRMRKNMLIIISSAQRLNNLVINILDHAKLNHKEIALDKEILSVHELTESVLEATQILVGEKAVLLVNNVNRTHVIHADANRVQQILYNLIGNAIKYTHTGSIEISSHKKAGFIEISIADTGVGILKEHQAGIFQSFEQLDGSSSREYGGTGLGLSITKHLVEMHGGQIEVFSELGMGATFSFTLPQSIELYQESATVHNPDLAGINEVESVNGDENELHILVVDDEPVNVQVIVNHLSGKNWGIVTADSGAAALEIIARQKIDLIILDIMMPKMSGIEVCQQVRMKFTSEEVAIIILTAKNTPESIAQGYQAGANDYATKPIIKEELLRRVDNVLKDRKNESVLTDKQKEIIVLFSTGHKRKRS